jgi:CRISPR-associated protein Cas5t
MIQLYIDVPIASFPRKFAHDYRETYLYPPVTTVFGCILSFVGEIDMCAYPIDSLEVGVINKHTEISSVCIRQRNFSYTPGGKHAKVQQRSYPPGVYPSQFYSKPNIKELVVGTKIVVRINNEPLAARVCHAIHSGCDRFGILSLGDSSAIVNCIREYRPEDGEIFWLPRHYKI